jgi:hypothetical protein
MKTQTPYILKISSVYILNKTVIQSHYVGGVQQEEGRGDCGASDTEG